MLILGGCAPGGCFPAPIQPAVGVTYQLTGTCVQAPLYPNPGQPCVGGDVTATVANDVGGVEEHTVSFPYSVTFLRPPSGLVSVSAQLLGDGTVTNGVFHGVDESTFSGHFPTVTCSGSL